MGALGKGQKSHIGTEDQADMRRPLGIAVPIFGKNFEGHGLRNRGLNQSSSDFDGESEEGWGVHPNGIVDCIDMRSVRNWKIGADPDTWAYLWNLEATIEENIAGSIAHDKGGIEHFINRLVIQVQLVFTGSVFIPDSTAWLINITSPSWTLAGSRGVPIPKPAIDPRGAAVREKMMRRRARALEKCGRK